MCIFSGRSLLWVAALGLIVIYNYAVGTFIFMPNEFDFHEEGEDNEAIRYCNTLFECTVTVLEYGLLDTIGGVSYLLLCLPTSSFPSSSSFLQSCVILIL